MGLLVPPMEVEAPIVDLETGDAAGSERFVLRQSRQIVHVLDLCNECGNCATFCVHRGRPFADKPRLALSRAAYDAADCAMLLWPGGLEGKDADGDTWRVEPHAGGVRVEDPHLLVDLDRAFCVTSFALRRRGPGRLSTARAIERAVLWQGLLDSPLRLFFDRAKGEL
jgi:putative selenate reductase